MPGRFYVAVIYRDAGDADWQTNPEAYTIEKKMVTAQSQLLLRLAKAAAA